MWKRIANFRLEQKTRVLIVLCVYIYYFFSHKLADNFDELSFVKQQSGSSRKERTAFTKSQVKELELEFTHSNYLTVSFIKLFLKRH